MTRGQREALRRSFQPSKVKLLFIGESPPASGRFFYSGDSGLYRAMRDVFRTLDPSISNATFLQTFRVSGCYLVDLCREPVDKLPPRLRRAACVVAEKPLARIIARVQPRMIATLVRSIEGNVTRALERGRWKGPIFNLPYPGRSSRHRTSFGYQLLPTLRRALRQPK